MHCRRLLIGALLILTAAAAAQQGARYLIITADQYETSIQRLAGWKRAAGISTKVVKLSECGSSVEQIRGFVQTAYDSWPIRPEFVLLVGSPYNLPAARYGNRWRYYSDNVYADMTGDVRAELLVGRFPARSAQQCDLMVEKTLSYKQTPDLTDTLWMRRPTTIVREGYDRDDTVYWNNVRHAAALAGQAGFVGCDSLSTARGDNARRVVASIDSGTGMVVYRGTAGGNWREPFEMDPGWTSNGPRLPVILSITCETMALDPYDSMLGSAFIRCGTVHEPKGAVAFYGNTHSAANVARQRGAVARGFFSGLFTENRYRLGDACVRSKEQLLLEFPTDDEDYRGFNLFGDPALPLWTATPRTMDVTHPDEVFVGRQEIAVSVAQSTAMANAVVCISMETGIWLVDTTDESGQVVFSVSTSDTGLLRVVVTAQDCRPYDGGIAVVAQSGLAEQQPGPGRPGPVRLAAATGTIRTGIALRVSTRPQSGWAVDVMDIDGRLVRRLACRSTSLLWDCEDASGSSVRAGVYLCLLSDGHGSGLARTKLALAK
jgi:hypothetical protein